jgi:fatty acid desaturase
MTRPPKDLRQYSSQTRRRLILGGLALIVLVGTALVAFTYGTPAAACAVGFFLIALVPALLIVAFLFVIQWIVQRAEDDSSRNGTQPHDRS